MIQPCPCGSQKNLATCCQPYTSGTENAGTPEQLMRSRYTAFCQGNVDYLIATLHPSKCKPDDRETLAQSIQNTEWLALRVLKNEKGQDSQNQGFVEFVAFYQEKPLSIGLQSVDKGVTHSREVQLEVPKQLHERSEFIKQQGRWFYLQGTMLDPILLSRGGPCWCGSGKKFKQCHGRRKSQKR